jgi:hypothetical protein
MLDTSTVILLGRLSDASALPTESVVSAVTLAELSVGPHLVRTARERVLVKRTCNKASPISRRFRSVPMRRAPSAESQRPLVPQAASPKRGCTRR